MPEHKGVEMPAAICPKCGMHNCAKELNYCMYGGCGYAFNDVMGLYKQKPEEKPQEIKTDKITGQVLLFGTNFLREG